LGLELVGPLLLIPQFVLQHLNDRALPGLIADDVQRDFRSVWLAGVESVEEFDQVFVTSDVDVHGGVASTKSLLEE
jgi:hypothetical protein